MKKLLLSVIMVLLSAFFISCKNEFSGKKYAAELMGVEVIGLDFLDNSKVEIYFVGAENHIANYSYDKTNQKVKIIDSEIEMDYTPSISVLKWQNEATEFVFHLVEEIKISTDIGFDLHPPLTPIPEGYKEVQMELKYYDSLGVVKNLTSDGKEISIEVVIGYEADDVVTSTTIENAKDEIQSWLKTFISQKEHIDFAPPKEPGLKVEIRKGLNEKLFASAPKIKTILIMDIY